MLELRQALAAFVIQLMQTIFKWFKPRFHRCALFDKRRVPKATHLAVRSRNHPFAETSLLDAPDHELRTILIGKERLADLPEEPTDLAGLLVFREARVVNLVPNDLHPPEELREDIKGALDSRILPYQACH